MGRKPKRGGGVRAKSAASSSSGGGKDETLLTEEKDLFHNGQTPACQLLVHASQDVFPELLEYRQGGGNGGIVKTKLKLHPQHSSSKKNNNNTDSEEEEVDDDSTLFQANRSSSDNTATNNNNSNTRTSSLLGQMLRWYVIQRRQEVAESHRQRNAQPQQQQQQQQGGGDGGGEDDDEDGPTNAGTKKKRKKKKKKKGGGGGGGGSLSHQVQEQESSKQPRSQQQQQQDDTSFTGTFGTFEGDDWPDNNSHPSVNQLNSSFTQHLNTSNNKNTTNNNKNNNNHILNNHDDAHMIPLHNSSNNININNINNNSISQLSATPSTEELQQGGVDTLDQSLHRHESRLRELKISRMPKLDSFPADDMMIVEELTNDQKLQRSQQQQQHHPNPNKHPLSPTAASTTTSCGRSESNNNNNNNNYAKDIINRSIPAPSVIQRAARDDAAEDSSEANWNEDDIAHLHSSTHFFQQILPQNDNDDENENDDDNDEVEMNENDGLVLENDDDDDDQAASSSPHEQQQPLTGGGEGKIDDQGFTTPTLQVHKTATNGDDSDTVDSAKFGSLTTPTKASRMDRHNSSGGSSKNSGAGGGGGGNSSISNGKTGGRQPPATPTHDLIPQEGAISVPETPPAEVIKNPLEVPYLLTLASNEAPWTMTIEGRHVPTSPFELRRKDKHGEEEETAAAAAAVTEDKTITHSAANPQENPQTGGATTTTTTTTPPSGENRNERADPNGDGLGPIPPPPPPPPLSVSDPFTSEVALNDLPSQQQQPEKSVFEEWLDRVVIGGELIALGGKNASAQGLNNPLPKNRDLESFLSYLQTRFHSSTDSQQQQQKTNKGGKQQQQRQVGAGIPVSSIVNACNEIDCSQCRDSAIAFLNRIQENIAMANATSPKATSIQNNGQKAGDGSKTSGKADSTNQDKDKKMTQQRRCCLVLNPETLELVRKEDNVVLYSPELQKEEEMTVQAAFDYVALEEGHHVPPSSQSTSAANENDDVVVVVGDDQEPSVDLEQFISFLPSNDSFGSSNQYNSLAPEVDGKTSSHGGNSKNSKKGNTGQQKLNKHDELYIQRIGRDHIESLIHHWLPCGMEEETLVAMANTARRNSQTARKEDSSEFPFSSRKKEQPLEPGELRELQVKVMDNLGRVRQSLDELEQLGMDIQQDFSKLVAQSPQKTKKQNKNLELKTFPLLRECDKKSVEYMEKMLHVLKVTTSERSHALQEVQLHIWTNYLRKLGSTLRAGDEYYTKIAEEMADQLGAVPKMFISLPLRNLYQSLVEQKVNLWTELGQFFSTTLTSSVLKEWFTRQAWQELRTSGDSTCSSRSSLDDDEASAAMMLDDWCHELTSRVSEWTTTILGGNVGEIQRGRMKQTEQVLELLQTINEPLCKEYATVERFFTPERNRYFAGLRSNISLAQGVKQKMRLIDQNEVETMATGVILMWRQVRIMQSRMKAPGPPLPPQLSRWMTSEDGVDAGMIEGFDWRAPNHLCLIGAGRGGKRRVMCVLAGLVYQWLDERCLEWNAELAEQELLTSMDTGNDTAIDLPTIAASGASVNISSNNAKNKKKNKKKRDKNKAVSSTSASPTNGGPEETSDNPANSKAVTQNKDVSDVPVQDGSPLGTAETSHDAVTADKESNTECESRLEEGTQDTTAPEELDGEGEEYDTFDSGDGGDNEEYDNYDEHGIDLGHPSAVGVIDSDNFQSPEEYLVGKFKEVLLLKGNPDVVFL